MYAASNFDALAICIFIMDFESIFLNGQILMILRVTYGIVAALLYKYYWTYISNFLKYVANFLVAFN